LWPPVVAEKYRKNLIWVGCFAAFFYAANWGAIALFGAVYGAVGHNPAAAYKALGALPHVSIAAAIGWGILKKSRIAASTGLMLSITGFIGNWVTQGFTSKSCIQCLIMVWILACSARAVFAHHKAVGAERNEKA